MRLRDRITNYLIGHRELGLNETSVLEHFRGIASPSEMARAESDADAVLASPGAPAIHRTPPLITCLCPTYGRCGTPWQHLLEESVEAFLRQSDRHSELLILNDDPAQEIVLAHPRVRVVNQPRRYATLGEKYNAMVRLAGGSLLAPWEDDDISLPHRLDLLRERLCDHDYDNPRQYWYLDRDGLHWDHTMGVGHNLSLFRRRAWQVVEGYPAVTGSQDAAMDELLTAHPNVRCRVDASPLSVPDWFYIYRWGVSPCHLSGQRDMQGFYDALGAAASQRGRFELEPHWRQDYSALAESARSRWNEVSSRSLNVLPQDRLALSTCDTTYKRTASYLAGTGRVEDWGCGAGYFRRFVRGLLRRHRQRSLGRLRPGRRPIMPHLHDRRHPAQARAGARRTLAIDSA